MGGQSVLFVCWGNICRSPTAEAIFKHFLKERGQSEEWKVDSAGTGEWNLGELPDPRTLRTLRYIDVRCNFTVRNFYPSIMCDRGYKIVLILVSFGLFGVRVAAK